LIFYFPLNSLSLLLGSSLDPDNSSGLDQWSTISGHLLLLIAILGKDHSLGHEQLLELGILILGKSLQNIDHVSSLLSQGVHCLTKERELVNLHQRGLYHVNHDGKFELKY
jgi:hypothetical protein